MNKIKPGYKKTSVGIIPEDWEVKRIGDLSNRIGDGIHSTPKYTENEEYFFINGNNLKEGRIVINENTKTVTEEESFKHKRDLNDRTILMSINGTIGNLAFYKNEKVILGKSACYLNILKEIDIKYFYFQIGSYSVQKSFLKRLTGSTIMNLGLNEIRKTKLPIPPLPEQKAIADCLSTWDKGIEKLSALIASKKEQKKGLMQQIFNGQLKVKNGQLIQAKDGEDFTKEWKKIELKEILTYEQPTKYLSNNFNDLLNENKVPVLTANKSFVLGYTDENVGIYNKLPVIIFDDFTTASRLVDFSFKVKSSAIKFLQTKSNFNIYFIFERLQLIKIDTTTHKRRWISEFENMVLSIPTIMEQNAFAQFIQTADKEIELLEKKLEAFKIQKKGLMQVLLTGTKRLV